MRQPFLEVGHLTKMVEYIEQIVMLIVSLDNQNHVDVHYYPLHYYMQSQTSNKDLQTEAF